ncbi:MAG TPA: amylo-alpha-1,6-glucosidase [Roseiflexaceae bacterium]|nr:amylo-alpha-1,6-glucosidase [Roseiflexaceae bacterium]
MSQHRRFEYGPYHLTAASGDSAAAPYFLAGSRMYVVGLGTGEIGPIGAEHLAGEMGGLWAHPVKVADGLTVELTDTGGAALPTGETELIERLSHVEWRWRAGDLAVRRRDFVAEDEAAFVALLTLRNESDRPQHGELRLHVWLKFLGCWFGGMESGSGEYWLENGAVLGFARNWQGRWGVACGMAEAPARCLFEPLPGGHRATLVCPFELAPGQSRAVEFLLAADHQEGHAGARRLFDRLSGNGEQLLHDKEARYHARIVQGVALETPDPAVDRAFALAKANLLLLSADYSPGLPPYFLAGIPEYPQLFGCDTEYSAPGAAAAGFASTTRSALLALAGYGRRACGRIPHEVTTNGRVFHPGNTQETPQFAQACWDYFRWTGDSVFLHEVYPLCCEGVDAYMPALWGGGPHSPYPAGDGVVERHGMGSRKLDSTCYLFGALLSLRAMAEALERPEDAARYAVRAEELRTRFEQDWWLEEEGLYADSLHSDGRPQLDGHWTAVLPLGSGLAAPERARRALDRIEREWVNQWGLVHTRAREELVWTLPTGLLALTEFRHGRADTGLRLLQNIAETIAHGTLGAFKELIPIGLCFVQLWSAALYLQGMLEGLLGLAPLAHRHLLEIVPCLPAGWGRVRLAELALGQHLLSLDQTPQGLELLHLSGPQPLTLRYALPADAGPLHTAAPPEAAHLATEDSRRLLVCVVVPGGRAHIRTDPAATQLELSEAADPTLDHLRKAGEFGGAADPFKKP